MKFEKSVNLLRNAFSTGLLLACVTTPVQGLATGYYVVSSNDVEWGLLNPLRGDESPRAANVWGDRTAQSAAGLLVKFKKGFSSPPHIHNVTYRGVVIEGLIHNDDPGAERSWLPAGSFWTQPAGESHITAAEGQENLIYLEIDSGPYLVLPLERAFDNGERAINVDARNLVWLNAEDTTWVAADKGEIAFLWGEPESANGSFVRLPAGFRGSISNEQGIKAVLVDGLLTHQPTGETVRTALSPGSFFGSDKLGTHELEVKAAATLYINSMGAYRIDQQLNQH